MPIYDFICKRCNAKIEIIRSVNESGDVECPRCKIPMSRDFSDLKEISIVKSAVPPEGKYSYAFGKYITTDSERKRLIEEKGLKDHHDWRSV